MSSLIECWLFCSPLNSLCSGDGHGALARAGSRHRWRWTFPKALIMSSNTDWILSVGWFGICYCLELLQPNKFKEPVVRHHCIASGSGRCSENSYSNAVAQISVRRHQKNRSFPVQLPAFNCLVSPAVSVHARQAVQDVAYLCPSSRWDERDDGNPWILSKLEECHLPNHEQLHIWKIHGISNGLCVVDGLLICGRVARHWCPQGSTNFEVFQFIP